MKRLLSKISPLSGASSLVACALLFGCDKNEGPKPNPPDRAMALTTVKTSSFTTAVPSVWEIHFTANNVLEAYDAVAPKLKHESSLQFIAQAPMGTCGGQQENTADGPACVTVLEARGGKVPSTIVEVQSPKHFLRLTHSVTESERPVSSSEIRALALRIMERTGPSSISGPQVRPAPELMPTADAQ